ncbi:hypothetical protein KCU71_g8446, partial [Aureobasidium melanogenum]
MDATEPLPPPWLLALVYFFTLTPIVALLAHTHLHHWQVLTVLWRWQDPRVGQRSRGVGGRGCGVGSGAGAFVDCLLFACFKQRLGTEG